MLSAESIQRKIGNTDVPGKAIILYNKYSTRAKQSAAAIRRLTNNHPYFASAVVIGTSVAFQETMQRMREHMKDGEVNVIVPFGGDTTFNQAAMAVEGTKHILCATRGGNATNASMNLQQRNGRILSPQEVIEHGSIKEIRPVEMIVDGHRRIAVTIADIGILSTGAAFLNGPMRMLPGYRVAPIRDLQERTILVARTLFSSQFPIAEAGPGQDEATRYRLGFTVANAPIVGHHARFPGVEITTPGAFVTELQDHLAIPSYAHDIQAGTLRGLPLLPGQVRSLRIGHHVLGSVDGEPFRIESGQTAEFSISPDSIRVFGLDEAA